MMRRLVLHPILFAVWPIAFLYSQNVQEQVPLGTVAGLVAVVVLATVALWGLAWLLCRDLRKAGLIASVVVVLFFAYGHLWRAIAHDSIAGWQYGRQKYALGVWALLAVVGLFAAARAGRRLPGLTSALNLIAGVLVVVNLVSSIAYALGAAGDQERAERASSLDFDVPRIPASVERPDIYYLIFDRYGSEATLRKRFGFDNSSFLEWLAARGFYVASDSLANYPRTGHSLASSLNMEYLDALPAQAGRDSGDWSYVYRLLEDFNAAHFAQAAGYRYMHVGSWFEPTKDDPSADRNYVYGPWSQFADVLYRTSILWPMGLRWGIPVDPRRLHVARIDYQFDKVAEVSHIDAPTFTFAHILLPHPPYVVDRDGKLVDLGVKSKWTLERQYLEQLRYANKRIEGLVSELLEERDGPRPVIILQSDEGPHPRGYERHPETYRWTEASLGDLEEKLNILNAYLLPRGAEKDLHQDSTPVNTFRIVFNELFDAGLPLLPERTYVFQDRSHPYRFTDVTERLDR